MWSVFWQATSLSPDFLSWVDVGGQLFVCFQSALLRYCIECMPLLCCLPVDGYATIDPHSLCCFREKTRVGRQEVLSVSSKMRQELGGQKFVSACVHLELRSMPGNRKTFLYVRLQRWCTYKTIPIKNVHLVLNYLTFVPIYSTIPLSNTYEHYLWFSQSGLYATSAQRGKKIFNEKNFHRCIRIRRLYTMCRMLPPSSH